VREERVAAEGELAGDEVVVVQARDVAAIRDDVIKVGITDALGTAAGRRIERRAALTPATRISRNHGIPSLEWGRWVWGIR
jgi:hypothetical protein